ncbi:DUF4214 domain-containing protein [Marinobacterium arenosum]|uniref:DUF4214 domain-containing protein n=1 Tax=Marinobacterium arenosum TaxID=2862496 RepID=UPI001C938590|nr:DUF4214 domain-containing protein [Marinobacterium arenosum]MBY4678746.1 DUF4214 domain-containing protein [Marinobacterium arenosum]
MSTSTFIDQLYTKFLYRDADTDGKAYWENEIDSGNATSTEVTQSFVASEEFQGSVAALSKLYFLVFDRIPDTEGLSFWVNEMQGGRSLENISAAFTDSEEFTTAYADATTNGAFLDQLYQNAFGRDADADGKAYWEGIMADGYSQADVISHFASSAEFDEVAGSDVQTTAIYYGILDRAPTTEELAAAGEDQATLIGSLYSSDDYSGEALPDQVSGKVIDGYISGATVFLDKDGDGVLDDDEVSTTTDADGDFSLTGQGELVATGGTDISTGLAFDGVLKAPSGSTVINPVTTLVQSLVDSGKSTADAEQVVTKALGLSSDVDLKTFDPIKEATTEGADETSVGTALAVQSANLKVANMLVQAAAVMQGSAGEELTAAEAMQATVEALAEKISEAADGDSTVDLSDATVLEDTVNKAVEKALNAIDDATVKETLKDKVAALADETATMLADANAGIAQALEGADTSSALNAIKEAVKIQTVAQGDAKDAIKAGAEAGDLTDAQDSYSGGKLTEAAGNVEVNDDAVTGGSDDANGGTEEPGIEEPQQPTTGGGGSSTPKTFTVNVNESTGVITFAGTATGNITVSISETDNTVTFVRGGITASQVIDLDDWTPGTDSIYLAEGQALLMNPAQAEAFSTASISGNNLYAAIEGDGTVEINDRTISSDTNLVPIYTSLTFTGSGGVAVESGATLALWCTQASGIAFSGDGSLRTARYSLITDGIEITTTTNGLNVIGSTSGDDQISVSGTYYNFIYPGEGADQITLGNGTDIVEIETGSQEQAVLSYLQNVTTLSDGEAVTLTLPTSASDHNAAETVTFTYGASNDGTDVVAFLNDVGNYANATALNGSFSLESNKLVFTYTTNGPPGDLGEANLAVDFPAYTATIDASVTGDAGSAAALNYNVIRLWDGYAVTLTLPTSATDHNVAETVTFTYGASNDGTDVVTFLNAAGNYANATVLNGSFSWVNYELVFTYNANGAQADLGEADLVVDTPATNIPFYISATGSLQPSDSYFSESGGTWDVISGFSLSADELELDVDTLLGNATETTVSGVTFTITDGVADVTSSSTLAEVMDALVTQVADQTATVAYYDSTTDSSYVFQGDGVTGAQDSDVFVQLVGVEVTDLGAILTS